MEPVIKTQPILNPIALKQELQLHPDRQFAKQIVDYAKYGVPVGYEGPRFYRESENWPSAIQYKEAVEKVIQNDISRRRKAGPFDHPPFETFVRSPMGAFPKKRSPSKYRVIHDLSWPPGQAVNDFIPIENYRLQYMTIDYIIHRIKNHRQGILLANLDLEDAFKHIMVRPEDWDLLGSI